MLLNTIHEPDGGKEGSSNLVILVPIAVAQSTLSLQSSWSGLVLSVELPITGGGADFPVLKQLRLFMFLLV